MKLFWTIYLSFFAGGATLVLANHFYPFDPMSDLDIVIATIYIVSLLLAALAINKN